MAGKEGRGVVPPGDPLVWEARPREATTFIIDKGHIHPGNEARGDRAHQRQQGSHSRTLHYEYSICTWWETVGRASQRILRAVHQCSVVVWHGDANEHQHHTPTNKIVASDRIRTPPSTPCGFLLSNHPHPDHPPSHQRENDAHTALSLCCVCVGREKMRSRHLEQTHVCKLGARELVSRAKPTRAGTRMPAWISRVPPKTRF